MFGDWKWGEHVAGAREGFLFFFVRMLPSWHGRSGGWLVANTDEKQAAGLFGLTLILCTWGCPGSLCRPSCYCWSWSCRESERYFCLGMQGHTVTHLQWKCDDFSFWLMYRPMSCQPWAAGGQIALYAFEMEVMILLLSACIRQIWM